LPNILFNIQSLNMSGKTFLIILCLLFYICQSLFFAFYGNIHADESTYLYAVKMVLEGKVLYRDFFYIQLPLLPYIYGFFLKFLGISLLTGRFISILFSITTVILTINIAKRLGGTKVAVICALLLCLNPFQGYFSTITRVYSPATFFLVLSIFFLTTKVGVTLRNSLAMISLCLAVECRLTVLPAILAVAAFFYLFDCRQKDRDRQYNLLPLAVPLLVGMVFFTLTLLPFALSAGFYEFFYQNLIYHLKMEMPSFTAYVVQKATAISTFFKGYFFISILISACLANFWLNRRRYKLIFQTRSNGIEACLWAIIIMITLLHLSAKYLQPSYQVVIFPLACVAASLGIYRIYDQVESQNLRVALLLIFLFGSLITPVSYGRKHVEKIEGKTALKWARETGEYIKSITDDDDLIMSSDTPLLAIEAGRKLLQGFENLEYYPDWPKEKCEKYKTVNDEILEEYIVNKVPKLIIIGDLSYTMSMPNRKLIGNEKHKKIVKLIEQNYSLIKKIPNLTHSIRGTNTYIYKRMEN